MGSSSATTNIGRCCSLRRPSAIVSPRFADLDASDDAGRGAVQDFFSAQLGISDFPEDGINVSGDGRFIVFTSAATNLVAGGWQGLQVYLRDRNLAAAYWQEYGSGYPGTHGIPSLSASDAPLLNQDTSLLIGNSSRQWTVALLMLGTTQVQWPTGWGGDLLVDPLVAILVALPPGGGSFTDRLAPDERFIGEVLYGQAIEIDPGALKGISFTPGVELGLGL